MAAIALLAAACSSGSSPSDAAPPRAFPDATSAPTTLPTTTLPTTTATTTTEATNTTRPPSTTTVPPTISTGRVTREDGTVTGTTESVDGRGNTTIRLPAAVGRPAIVHAQHDGSGPFTVTAIDAAGKALGIVAQSTGSYGGTFPIGFVDETDHPTSGLTITTDDAWHLDIAPPTLTPQLIAPGTAGHGDAVLAYLGPAVSARVTAKGGTPFTIHTYDRGSASLLANTVGPYDARIELPAGPAFISVTAAGDWSMSLR